MPVLGQGVMPTAPLGSELVAVTRRAFIPKMIVQIYNSSPFISALLANANTAYGGVSSVTLPVQGTPFVNSQWTDYSGSFQQPQPQQGAYPAEFNLKAIVAPIPFLGMEAAVQLNHAVIPLIEARMNDATASLADALSQALFNNFTNNQQIIGLPGAVDDGTNLVVYGNINRTANQWWQSKLYNAGAVAPTRARLFQYIAGANKIGAEVPTMGLCGPGTFVSLGQDIIGQESYRIIPGAGFDSDADRPRAAFRALDIAGVPVYMDPYCPEGTVYLLNTNYINLYVHSEANFTFSGFESLLSNMQIGYIGAVLTLLELVLTKPKSCTKVTNFTFTAI
jgi:hypothetical protein